MGVKIDSSTIKHEECDQGKEILTKWSHIFSTGPTDLGDTDLVEHEIHLTDNIPFKDPCRRIPPGIFEDVRQNLNEILSVGPPWGPGGISRECAPPYPQRDRKRRLNGAVCRNHRIKRLVPCRC